MISRSQIEELRDKWQTTELNVAREFTQHVLLSSLYSGLRGIKLAFKGGTALRLLRDSPRFSEDLDFTGYGKAYHAGEAVKTALRGAAKAGLDFDVETSEATSGGWFAAASTKVHEWPVRIEWNVSLRPSKKRGVETILVATPLWASYSVQAMPEEEMVYEKVDALFRRKKPRDFFDLYFVLRQRLGVKEVVKHKGRLLKEVRRLNAKSLSRELRDFLPRSHAATIKDLPKALRRELERL